MKKPLTLSALLLMCLAACEPDDICLEGTLGTPKLIIEFYDKNQDDTKKSITDLQVKGINMDVLLYDATVDSIALPLNTLNNNTSFSFTKTQNNNAIEDIITFNYDLEDRFISRACGYKTVFNNLTFSTINTLNFISKIEILTDTISDINTTNVKILH
tara:strand:- start:1790 stop:2263 length:474 start_codon:yes stop_codon:yes gene_type:complete